MSYRQMVQQLRNLQAELAYLRAVDGLFLWDQWMGLPPEGATFRQQVQAYMSGRRAEIFRSQDAFSLAEYLSGVPLEEIEDPIERAAVRKFLYQYHYTANVPVEKMQKLVMLTAQAQSAWVKARAEKEYEIFKPFLRDIFSLQVEIASHIDPQLSPFEVMVGASDEGVSLQEVNREFALLKNAVSEIVKRIQASPVSINDSFLSEEMDQQTLFDFAKFIVEKMGYESNRGGYGRVIHPFTDIFGPKDARITVNCDTYRLGIFGAIHEAGHAMYSYRGNADIDAANLWGGVPGGFHEAQSRFYENIVGKSKAFWQFFYPEVQKRFPHFAGISIEHYYQAINKVQPSLQRITADEVTYSLHPIIRFELEQELIDGSLDFDALPQAWNDRYDQYLGVRPADDTAGVLQDIHWAAGALGYFQSYALGNIYGGQMRAALIKEVPDVFEEIASGNFEPLNGWLTERIHQYGDGYTATEMIHRISAQGLNTAGFTHYLEEKYSQIYQLAHP